MGEEGMITQGRSRAPDLLKEDKDGGFGIASGWLFNKKAMEAVETSFK